MENQQEILKKAALTLALIVVSSSPSGEVML